MVDRFDMQFTCKLCDTRNEHSISRRAYTKGTVIVTCPGCDATHLVADNLNWIEDDFVNLEFIPRGTDTSPIVPALARVFDAALAGGGAKSINFQGRDHLT